MILLQGVSWAEISLLDRFPRGLSGRSCSRAAAVVLQHENRLVDIDPGIEGIQGIAADVAPVEGMEGKLEVVYAIIERSFEDYWLDAYYFDPGLSLWKRDPNRLIDIPDGTGASRQIRLDYFWDAAEETYSEALYISTTECILYSVLDEDRIPGSFNNFTTVENDCSHNGFGIALDGHLLTGRMR